MKILISRNELEKKLAQGSGGQLIELCIVPQQSDSGCLSPAFLHVGSIHTDGTYEDLESIDEYPESMVDQQTA